MNHYQEIIDGSSRENKDKQYVGFKYVTKKC